MTDPTPLNPDALKAAKDAFDHAMGLDTNDHFQPWEEEAPAKYRDIGVEPAVSTYLTAAQPEVNSVEKLVTTRVGLALANAAFKEGVSAGIRACNESLEGEPFVKPVSPYSAPLLAMIKADRPEVPGA